MATSRRMKRDEFFARVEELGAGELRQVLWNLYWRGTSDVRQRVENELHVARGEPRPSTEPSDLDPEGLAGEVQDFCLLAYEGAYLGGSRQVSPRERSRWRLTFRRFFRDLSRGMDEGQFQPAASALEQLVDLACYAKGYHCFRSEDPLEAAKVVISDQVELLWRASLKHEDFGVFARRSAAQLIRWEELRGWTTTGFGSTAEREVTLASVLAGLLQGEAWLDYAGAYAGALDLLPREAGRQRGWTSGPSGQRRDRARRLREWHERLVEAVFEREGGAPILRRIVKHRELDGPDIRFIEARIAHLEKRQDVARAALAECLKAIPRDPGVLDLARRLGMPAGGAGTAGR